MTRATSEPSDAIGGEHFLVDLYDCDPASLDDREALVRVVREAAVAARATVLEVSSHRFSPHGVTALALLAESHLSIHTWPEHRYAAVDLFTCSTSMRPDAAIDLIAHGLGSTAPRVNRQVRGRRDA